MKTKGPHVYTTSDVPPLSSVQSVQCLDWNFLLQGMDGTFCGKPGGITYWCLFPTVAMGHVELQTQNHLSPGFIVYQGVQTSFNGIVKRESLLPPSSATLRVLSNDTLDFVEQYESIGAVQELGQNAD